MSTIPPWKPSNNRRQVGEPHNGGEVAAAEYMTEMALLVRSRAEDDQRLQTFSVRLQRTYCFQRDSSAFPRM